VALGSSPSGGGLDRYRRDAELGRGAMGIVYRARDLVLDRDVALKIMTDEMRSYPQALSLFVQEAKALAKLNHRNVVAVYDQGRDGETLYMVMEFVEGTSLEALIADQRLPLAQLLDITQQLCSGLAYAHERKVLHRDIKPANVLVSESGQVKLGDFGLARVVQELQIRKTEIRGTPLYMAPEQIIGQDIDARTDLYAVGCTLFELLTGRPPFIDGDVLYHHMHTEPPRPSDLWREIPPDLDGLVVRCIQKEKEKRFASAAELGDRLRQMVQRYC
jgi:serine/threonine-protein kinase